MATERIVIIVSENGTEQVIKKIGGVGKAAKSSGDAVSFLQSALGLLGAAATIKGIIGLLDTFTELENKLRTISKSEDEAAFSTQKLLDVANRSRSSFEDTVTLYQRVVRSTQQLGVTHAESARIVETLNKAVIVGGASAIEASAALIQLSQGFSAGVLRGQELRSVMTQMPLVADILAKKLNTTIGGLLKLGPAGKITAKIMADALLEASTTIDESFAKTVPTVSQQLTVLKNNVIKFVGDFNAKFQILPKITAAIDFLSDHIETFARVVLAGIFVVGVSTAITAINALTAAIAANPVGAIAVAVTAAVAALVLFSDQIKLTEDGAATLSDFFAVLFEEIGADLVFLKDFFKEQFQFISDIIEQVFGSRAELSLKGFILLIAKVIDSTLGAMNGLIDAIVQLWDGGWTSVEFLTKSAINGIIALVNDSVKFIIDQFNNLAGAVSDSLKIPTGDLIPLIPISAQARVTGDAAGKAFLDGFRKQTDAQDLVGKLFGKAEQRAQERLKSQATKRLSLQRGEDEFNKRSEGASAELTRATEIDGVISKLTDEAEALSKVIENRKISNDYVRIEQQLRKKGIELTPQETAQIQTLLERNEQLKITQQIYQQIRGPQEEAARAQQALNDLYAGGKITLDQYQVALRNVQIRQLETSRDAASGFQRGFLKVQDEITNFAGQAEATVTNAFHGMEDALVDFVKTGKLNFSSLVDSILSDLTRLLLRQALSGLLGSLGGPGGIFGGIAAGAASGAAGARAGGGPVSPGKAYMVGEHGPEMFRPNTGGSISANGAPMMGGASPVHVTVINQIDPDDVARALADPKTDQLIVNKIQRNRQAVKSAIN